MGRSGARPRPRRRPHRKVEALRVGTVPLHPPRGEPGMDADDHVGRRSRGVVLPVSRATLPSTPRRLRWTFWRAPARIITSAPRGSARCGVGCEPIRDSSPGRPSRSSCQRRGVLDHRAPAPPSSSIPTIAATSLHFLERDLLPSSNLRRAAWLRSRSPNAVRGKG